MSDRPAPASGRRASRRVVTIGVYGLTRDGFLEALRRADVGLLMDVRRRRGVRGAEYAWANAKRLQAALDEAGIEYRHHLELAPSAELRKAQFDEDKRGGVGPRSRRRIAAAYRDGYLAQVLDRVDLGAIVESMPRDSATALFCVEAAPEACHRALIAERMASDHGAAVEHLRPA
ncbi:MAG: DUF488 domain-containing protein [Actinobacteria bacterium]|nr:DUF488 domain-containing protein [Actinomycetota bacterium]